MAKMPARFWLLERERPSGPFVPAELLSRPGFGPYSLVCPEREAPADRRSWRPAWRLKELAGAFPGFLPDAEPQRRESAPAQEGLLPPSAAPAPSSPRPVESRARPAPPSRESSLWPSQLFVPLAAVSLLIAVPIALLTRRPAEFKSPLPAAPDSSGADPWQRCLAARRFDDCAASCRKTPGCRVPDPWDVCHGWLGSAKRCAEFCSETGQCKPPAEPAKPGP